jgi:hypothetical protein
MLVVGDSWAKRVGQHLDLATLYWPGATTHKILKGVRESEVPRHSRALLVCGVSDLAARVSPERYASNIALISSLLCP